MPDNFEHEHIRIFAVDTHCTLAVLSGKDLSLEDRFVVFHGLAALSCEWFGKLGDIAASALHAKVLITSACID